VLARSPAKRPPRDILKEVTTPQTLRTAGRTGETDLAASDRVTGVPALSFVA